MKLTKGLKVIVCVEFFLALLAVAGGFRSSDWLSIQRLFNIALPALIAVGLIAGSNTARIAAMFEALFAALIFIGFGVFAFVKSESLAAHLFSFVFLIVAGFHGWVFFYLSNRKVEQAYDPIA